MDDLSARATLVPAPDLAEGLTTRVSRSEIEEVLESEGPIELVLDITSFSDGKPPESRRVAVAWDRPDLERVLEEAADDEVVLTFDRGVLEEAMADVEGHGLREAALALAVAATAATGMATKASADPGPPFLTQGTPAAQNIAPDDRAVPRPTPVSAPVAETTIAPDDRAVPRPTPVSAPAPDIAPDDRAVPRPTPVAPATPVAAPTADIAPDDRAVPRPTPSAPVTTPGPGTVSDPGISWSPTTAEAALLAGIAALAITGAFFLVGGRRVRPRPA